MMRRLAARFHYGLLPRLLRCVPWLVWRWPAVILGTARWLVQREVGRAVGPALVALGQPATRLARWRFAWLVAYHEEANFLLSLQPEKVTEPWVARHVRREGMPPPGGAVLISLHHNFVRFSYWRLRLDGLLGGLVASDVREGWDPAHPDYQTEYAARGDRADYFARRRRSLERILEGRIYRPPDQLRSGARFLQAGGYLIVLPDGFTYPVWERGDLLGKAIPVAPGPAWLARRTGKPIVPFMVIPERRGWRVWFGEPVPPTQEGVAAALTACLRRAPTTLHGIHWQIWHNAPCWQPENREAGERPPAPV
jgi:hypothetical protein